MARRSPEWLDRMYNNRALVPEHAMHFARWAEASEDAREAHPCVLDVPYGSGPQETLDIFPARAAGSPVVVFIHGGYWRSLDKSEHSFLAVPFRNQGACVVVPNYALCPAVTIPDIVMQMVRAVDWVHAHAAEHGGDPARVYLVGHSAGGHLATQLMLCEWPRVRRGLPADLVKGALSISGLYDLEPVSRVPFLQSSLRLTPEQVQRVSPARLPAPATGTLYTVVGGDESAEFLRQNGVMRKAWGARRVPVVERIAGRNHFSVLEDLSLPGTRLHALAMQLVFGIPAGG